MKTTTLLLRMAKRALSCTIIISSVVLLSATQAQSQTVLGAWDFRGEGGNFTNSGINYGDLADSNVQLNSLQITTGSGFLFRNYLGNGFTVSRQNATTLGMAISENDYLTFKISPKAGQRLTITGVKLRPVAESGGSYPRNFTLFSNQLPYTAGNQLGSVVGNIALNGPLLEISNFNIVSANEVEFRLYIWGNYANIFQGVGLGNRDLNQGGYDLVIEGYSGAIPPVGLPPFAPQSMPEAQLGLSGVSYHTAPYFANAIYLESRGWMQDGGYITADPTSPQFDNNGYPKYLNTNTATGAVIPVFVQPGQNDNPDDDILYRGRVTLTWEGDADIRITSATCISGNCTGKIVNGTRVYTTPGTGAINGYTIKVMEINTANYPKKIRCWMPDPTDPWNKSLTPIGGEERIWHPSYLEKINVPQIGIYRFMDMGSTNANPLVNWNERRTKDHCFMAGATVKRIPYGASSGNLRNSGIAYEFMIDLVNRTGKDAWICVPHGATNDFITQMARLFKNQLNTNRRVYVEYSNEVWACASAFPQGCYMQTEAAARGLSTDVYIGRKFAEVWSLWKSEFGTSNQPVYVITQQTGNSGRFKTTIDASIAHGATLNPSVAPMVMAPTTYFGNSIQTYIFENLNYMNPTAATYDSVFTVWESRILNSEASQTGRDFTGGGGGFDNNIVKFSKDYNLPIIPYEGGTGLQFADFFGFSTVAGESCRKVFPTNTPGTVQKELACAAGECSGGSCNSSPYHTFMYNLMVHPKLKTMFLVHNTLGKAKGVRTFAQFGCVSKTDKYGQWGFLTHVTQPYATAYKYQHVLEFAAEQATINEIFDSVGTRPYFTTYGELNVGKVGVPYIGNIDYAGGDGTKTATIVGTGRLHSGLTLQYQANRIRISGTPTEHGIYRILVRVLDANRDPAYGVFTIRILPAPKNLLMAHENFGTQIRPLHNSNNGTGFSSAWSYQSSHTLTGISTASPLSYNGLYSSGNGYADGKNSSFNTAGRALDIAAFDYLAKSTGNVIGQTNASLWVSYLVRRETGAPTTQAHLYLNNGSIASASTPTESRLRYGVSNGNWAIWVRNASNTAFNVIESNVSANTGSTNLIVSEIRFGNVNDTIRLFINPTQLGGNAPATPNLVYVTTFTGSTTTGMHMDMEFNRIGFYGNNGTAAVQIDDIRLGDTYRAVTPTTAPNRSEVESVTDIMPSVYPNPASGFLYINNDSENYTYRIINISGHQVAKGVGHKLHKIDISGFPTGLYLVYVENKAYRVIIE